MTVLLNAECNEIAFALHKHNEQFRRQLQ